MSEDILIAGAGLTGLSAAYHLRDRRYRLVEAESVVGGLCRSIRQGGFTFDHTGHLLHLRRPEVKELVSAVMGEQAFLKIDRRSGIYSHGVYTDYPFQVNLHGLPNPVVRECVMGFAEVMQHSSPPEPFVSFHDWILATFGEGIARHFLFPYNRKLFCTDLREMTADWCSWSIPKPSWPDVIRGALGTNRKAFGYNPNFLYPAEGGIDHLPRAFLPHIREPMLSTTVVAIDLAKREARLSNGEVVRFSAMISSLGLPALLDRIVDLPENLRQGARRLCYVSVLNLNLGFDAPCPRPYQWVYFPEPSFPFYRIGVYSNLCPASVPEQMSSFYVEISHRANAPANVDFLVSTCAEAIRSVGLLPPGANLCQVRPVSIPFAYVVHDSWRSEFLPEVLGYLEERRVLSAGRYGAWEYSAMEDALWHGRCAAASAQKW